MSAVNYTYSKFKDFKDHFQNSRTFQGSSKIATEIQGLFKDFKDLFEIQGFQGFFQGCGHPGLITFDLFWGIMSPRYIDLDNK